MEIRDIAIREDRIIITQDTDFLDSYLVKGSDPKILLIQLDDIKNSALIDLFKAILKH